MCIHPGHTGHRLVPLPLGPKWQWYSTSFDGEDKVPTKNRLVEAGGHDPQKLFRNLFKEKIILVAMDVGSTDDSYYRPYIAIRRQIVSHLNSTGMLTDFSAPFSVRISQVHHADYLNIVANSTFVLCPPGRFGGIIQCTRRKRTISTFHSIR